MNIREIDTADWEASERAEVVALPYTVTSSPYGETLFQAFATEAEAVEAAEYVQGLTGTYNTSWGEQDVNTEVVVSHYVDSTPAPVKAAHVAPRTVAWIVLPHGAYPDTASDYVACATRADVERELVDYGWLDNPGVFVYRVVKGETTEGRIAELASSPDPYPDFVVERGPRGGVQWNIA